MKILHVENSSGQGGSLKSLQALWPAPESWQVLLLALERDWAREFSLPYPVIKIRKQCVYRVWRLLQEEKIDIVHINNSPIEAWSVIVAAFWEGIPVVSHFRSVRPLRKIEYFLLRGLKRIWVLSNEHRKFMPQNFPVKVLHHPMPFFEMSKLPDANTVGIFSVLKEGKGHEDILNALFDIDLPWHLNIVGGPVTDQPSIEKKLRRLIQSQGRESQVSFVGHVDNPLEWMKTCFLIVDPSRKAEGFRRTIVEATLLGRRVLASRVGGAADLLKSGQLIEAGNVVAWKKSLFRELSRDFQDRELKEQREKALVLFNQTDIQKCFWEEISSLVSGIKNDS
jgi:glycosyltransferase involved in cell wall biosynthesis